MFWNQVVPGVVSSTSCQLYIYRRAFEIDSRPPTRTPLVALNILVTPLQRIGFYTGSVCVPYAVGAPSMIHLLHDLQEVCQSLNYVKHNEKHVIGWCHPAVGSFRLRCWVYSFSTTLRTFGIRNNLTAGSYFLSRDRATDKIAQKLLSFTTFCYRPHHRQLQSHNSFTVNKTMAYFWFRRADRMKNHFAVIVFLFGTLVKLGHVCKGKRKHAITQHAARCNNAL